MAKANEVLIYIKDKLSIGGLKSLPGIVSGVGTKIRGVFTALAIGAVATLTAAFWQLTKAVKEFAAQELGETDLNSALKQMGVYTDAYRAKLVKLANQYQSTTNIGDEMWLKALATLTRFGATSENIDEVAEATKNLAALMDGNLQGAVLAMQRAIEGEFSMFSRYGIKLDLTGDKVTDLNNLMTKLAEKGGGLLEARTETLSGKTWALKNAITDFREEIGRTLTESIGLKDGLDLVIEKFQEWQESAKSGKVHEIIQAAAERLRAFADTVAEIVSQINSLQDLKAVFTALGNWLKDAIKVGGQKAAAYLLEKAPAIGNAIASGVLDGIPGASLLFGGALSDQQRALNQTKKNFTGEFASAEWDAAYQSNYSAITNPSGATEELGSLSDYVSAALETSQNIEALSEQLSSLMERVDAGNMDLSAVQDVVESWQLSDSQLQQLREAMGESGESAVEASEAANTVNDRLNDAANAVDDAATDVGGSLERATEKFSRTVDAAATAATKAAEQSETQSRLLDGVLAVQAQLTVKALEQDTKLAALQFEIKNLKA